MALLLPYPLTRINDYFVKEETNMSFDFREIIDNFKDPIVEGKPGIDHRFQADFYKKIAVDIVTETTFNYPYPFITEKTYRAFSSLRPFIIIGPYGTLKFLKSFGFQTFSAIINESYDEIKDPEMRFSEACDSIREFVSRPLEEIKQNLISIEDILIYNQQHMITLFEKELKKFEEQL